MKKLFVKDKDTGIVQITICDERWYAMKDEAGQDIYVPSVTWIASYYPKGIGFYKWLASKGWDEAQAIKQEAAEKGSKVHKAISDLLKGKEVRMDSTYYNESLNAEEELTLEEYEAVMSFVDWYDEYKPQAIRNEIIVWNDEENYAGTVDLVCSIGGKLYVIDFKTSSQIWPSHEIQISAYKHADFLLNNGTGAKLETAQCAILQLGYKRNKTKYKFTEIEDKFDLFLSAQRIWQHEASKQQPFVKDYPTSLKLKEVKNETA